MTRAEEGRRQLDDRGWVRLDGFLSPLRRQRLAARLEALFAAEGESAGSEFRREPGARRLANLVDKGEEFVECILEPEVLALVAHVLGPRFKLSSLNARAAEPGADAAQPLHVDTGTRTSGTAVPRTAPRAAASRSTPSIAGGTSRSSFLR